MQRRGGGGQRPPFGRASSGVENGHTLPSGGQLCPGGGACLVSNGGGGGGGGGYTCGCIRKSSALRRAVYTLRFAVRRITSRAGASQKGALGAYLAAGVFLLWVGLQVAGLLRGAGYGGGVVEPRSGQRQQQQQRRELTEATTMVGYREEDVGPRLAYGIMVYQRKGYSPQKTLDQFGRMFNALYDAENTYVIHVDSKADPALTEAIWNHVLHLPNVHDVPSVSVSWAGITVVERTLALMTKAVEVDDTWRFFVNIGHEDYPSASQAEMRRWMKGKEDGTNFIKCWPIEGHDFFGQWEHHEGRLQDVYVDDFVGGVREYRTVNGRPGSQERPKTDYKFYKSLQQTMLSRDLTEYAVYSNEARRLLLYMATSKAPDELYFPTLTQLDKRFADRATCDDTRHFSYWVRPGGSWHPEYLTMNHLPIVLNATEFYIRKLEVDKGSGPLLDTLDILRAGHPLEATLPIMIAWLNRKGEDGVSLAAVDEGGPVMKFPEDATVEEALGELYRRQSEDAECRRALFLGGMHRRSRKKQENTAAAAALVEPPGKKSVSRSQREAIKQGNPFKRAPPKRRP